MTSSPVRPLLLLTSLLALPTSCTPPALTGTPPVLTATASAWPEADGVFQHDARFLGSDSAYSVSLGGAPGSERVLWMFGDTFVATDDSRSRRHSHMVRNSLAVMTGADPSSPSTHAAFFFGADVTAPDGTSHATSFFPDGATLDQDGNATSWTWPGTPALVDGKLLLFLWSMKVAGAGSFGFALDHTRAVLVDNPQDDPPAWHFSDVTIPTLDAAAGVAWGTGGALVDGDGLLLLGVREPGDHRAFLAHVSVHDAARGDLSHLVVDGDLGFNSGTELSLTHAHDAFEVVSIDGFGQVPVVIRSATSLATAKPPAFSGPSTLFTPQLPAGAFDYSAKAHPELNAGGDLAATFCTNGDFAAVLDDMSLYFPRFVRVHLESSR